MRPAVLVLSCRHLRPGGETTLKPVPKSATVKDWSLVIANHDIKFGNQVGPVALDYNQRIIKCQLVESSAHPP